MKKITLFCFMLVFPFLACQTTSQKISTTTENAFSPGYLMDSQLFEFYNHYWLNLHHFLHSKADWLTKKSIEASLTLPIWETMQDHEKTTITNVLHFYKDNILQEDLRTGDLQYAFKNWVIQQKENTDLPNNPQFADQIRILNKVKKIYSKYWWSNHQKSNVQVLQDNIVLIKKLEITAKEKITQLAKANWQTEKIRVDICYYGKLGRPYTSTDPTHIVMNVGRNVKPAGSWFELLFHEASHHFIFPSGDFVGGTINQAVEDLGMKAPRGLWHGYLFYFTGKVSQELLVKEGITDYELYMVRRKVFDWFYPLLDKHLPAYLDGKATLADCTKQIIVDFQKAENKSN